MSATVECEGACHRQGGHSDTLYRVHVEDREMGRDYGEFLYCMQAVRTDRCSGLHVEVLNEVQR